jgi:hypothetical protein
MYQAALKCVLPMRTGNQELLFVNGVKPWQIVQAFKNIAIQTEGTGRSFAWKHEGLVRPGRC